MIDPAHIAPSISRPIRKPVGITKGPGESTHEYTFVSRDDAQELKNGEYVYYELSEPDESGLTRLDGASAFTRRVLGRIIKRVPLKLYPDTFLAEPEISPAQVAAMVGYDARANELFELHVAIMASTGAGKSYLASVIIEELMQPYNKACVLILDPHGEYNTLSEIANATQFAEQGDGRGSAYRAQIKVYKPEQVKVRISSLKIGDMRH